MPLGVVLEEQLDEQRVFPVTILVRAKRVLQVDEDQRDASKLNHGVQHRNHQLVLSQVQKQQLVLDLHVQRHDRDVEGGARQGRV